MSKGKKSPVVMLGVVLFLLGSTLSVTLVKADSQETTLADTISTEAPADFVQRDHSIGPGYYSPGAHQILMESHARSFLARSQDSHQSFLNAIKPAALKGWARGLLPSITAAQAIVESEWGQSGLTVNANNLFGYKGSYNGSYVEYPTQEYSSSRGWYWINAPFKKYPSWDASIADYMDLLTSDYYKSILFVRDYHLVAQSLQDKGYATAPNYAQTLINIIDTYGLAAWDQEAQNSPESEAIAQIVYIPGYGVIGFNNTGSSIPGSNQKFKDGTRWQTFGSKVINGEEMYDVGGGQFVPKKYTNHYDDGIVTIHYEPGYGVNAVRGDGTQILGSNTTFKTGTRWKIVGVKEINGGIYYAVGNDTYIAKKYTQWGTGK
jgi:hypothetical protein